MIIAIFFLSLRLISSANQWTRVELQCPLALMSRQNNKLETGFARKKFRATKFVGRNHASAMLSTFVCFLYFFLPAACFRFSNPLLLFFFSICLQISRRAWLIASLMQNAFFSDDIRVTSSARPSHQSQPRKEKEKKNNKKKKFYQRQQILTWSDDLHSPGARKKWALALLFESNINRCACVIVPLTFSCSSQRSFNIYSSA